MKKQLLKRAFLSALCGVLVLSAAGCGEKVTTSEQWVEEEIVVSGTEGVYVSGTEGTAGNGTDADFSGNSAAPSKDGAVDLKGAEVVISTYGEESQPGTPVYQNEQKLKKQIEEKYNCKLTFKYITDSNIHNKTWVTQASAGVKFADIVGINTEYTMPSQIMKGYITPIDSYFDFDDPALNKKKMNMVSFKGKHYMVFPSTWTIAPNGIYFNKAVFTKLGVKKTPADYVAENNWNWDTFLECAKATTKVDGGNNYYGFAMQKGTVRVFLQTNGLPVSLVRRNADGSHSLVLNEPKAITAMQFAKDLYNGNYTTGNLTDSENTWKKGFAAMIFGPSYNGTTYLESLGSENVGFTFLPLGKDVNGYTEVYKSNCGKGWIIPSTVKNPVAIAKIMYDWIYPYTWKQSWNDYHEKFFGDAASLNSAKEMTNVASRNFELDSAKYDFITNKIAWNSLGVDTDQSPQAYAASVMADATAELKQVWEGYEP